MARPPEGTTVSDFELVIVGGGLASARAIKAYREAGGNGAIALFSRDSALPYHRPPLSKRYLRGEAEAAETLVEPAEFYDKNEVALLLKTDVASVDPHERAVETREGKRHSFEKLLIATGAVPRRLEVEGADLPGVFTLRTLEDATAIRQAAAEVRDAVVVGGGFIGMEVAASLSELELDVRFVHRGVDLFAQLGSPEISEHLVDLYRRRGVEVSQGVQVDAFRGHSALDSVELHAGEQLGARLAVVGIGVAPAVGFLEGSGVAIGNGVLVNERFETNVPGIYAVGDVACFPDPLFGRRRRIEHWSNANYQGSEVGRILAGAEGGYDTVSSFFTESFGLTLKVFGDTSQHDDRVARGAFADGEAIVFYLVSGRLVGTLLAGQDEETENRLRELIRERAVASDVRALADESVTLDQAFAAAPESRAH
jgi:NADPH-dependent 2,4-dienoyl-CoA reductase/sulfur reductase-like enzyme